MPSKQWVRLPVSTTVGVTLLGLSATLFAVDVGGTIVLDNDRPGAERPASAVAAQRRAPAAAPAHTVVAAVIARAVPSVIAAAGSARREPARLDVIEAVAYAPPVREPLIPAVRLEFVKPPSHAAMHLPVVSLDHPAEGAQHMLPPAVRLAPKPGPDPGVRAVPRPVATLRDVRRFVMRQLSSRDRHVCVISAMTYAVGGRQVIVDLVYRDSKGRWSEKAVVRRGGTTIKLVGVKQRPLLDKTVAAAQVVPPAIVSEP